MPWFRAGLSAILLFTTTLVVFFPHILGSTAGDAVVASSRALGPVLVPLQVLLVVGAAYGLARAAARGTPKWRNVAAIVGLPTALVGGGMGVYAALAPIHLVIVAALAAAVMAATWWGARHGGRA